MLHNCDHQQPGDVLISRNINYINCANSTSILAAPQTQNTAGANASMWARGSYPDRRFEPRASIVLIGLPGAGKRSLGFIAATHLKRRFCTDHNYFQKITGMTKVVYLQNHGRENCMRRSHQVFEQLLSQNARDCVIECGVSSLASSSRDALVAYGQSHPVINILRDSDEFVRQLQLQQEDIRRLRHADANHRLCSNFEYYNLFDTPSTEDNTDHAFTTSPWTLRKARIDFCNFVDFVLGRVSKDDTDPFHISRLPISKNRRSYATRWSISALVSDAVSTAEMGAEEDVIDLNVDVWEDTTPTKISKFIAQIRRQQNAPIVYSVNLPVSALREKILFEAIQHGIRLAAEYIVVDCAALEDLQIRILLSKGHSVAIAHHHFEDVSAETWSNPDRLAAYAKAKALGYDIVRFTQEATSRRDNAGVRRFYEKIELDHEPLPLVAYNTGYLGRHSKIHSSMLTPAFSFVQQNSSGSSGSQSSGEMTIKEITQALFANFEYDPLQFYVLGSSISFTRSPVMHAAAFQFYGLAHNLQHSDAASLKDVQELIYNERCGGCCISFPFKEAAFEVCTSLSAHAQAIGSVNTIIPLRQLDTEEKTRDLTEQAAQRNKAGPVVGLHGDNNDWQGFYYNIRRKLSPRNAALDVRSTALVLGAGGSARAAVYALILIGYQHIYIHNRTEQRALQLAEHFNTWCVRTQTPAYRAHVHILKVIEGVMDEQWPKSIDFPTAIVACVPTAVKGFVFPKIWLDSPTGGVAADISYGRGGSKFLDQVRESRRTTQCPWAIVDGLDILLDTAVMQFECFTGYRAPRARMRKSMLMVNSSSASAVRADEEDSSNGYTASST